jgi:hypothetical protein
MAIPGPAGLAVRAIGSAESLTQTLRDSSPEDLRVMNRLGLERAGIEQAGWSVQEGAEKRLGL